MKELKFYNKDRDGNTKVCGSMTIKNQTDSSADLFFYGDIVSETWQSEWYEDDMAPGDVKNSLISWTELKTLTSISILAVVPCLAVLQSTTCYAATMHTRQCMLMD